MESLSGNHLCGCNQWPQNAKPNLISCSALTISLYYIYAVKGYMVYILKLMVIGITKRYPFARVLYGKNYLITKNNDFCNKTVDRFYHHSSNVNTVMLLQHMRMLIPFKTNTETSL